jgi:hypothetical protein
MFSGVRRWQDYKSLRLQSGRVAGGTYQNFVLRGRAHGKNVVINQSQYYDTINHAPSACNHLKFWCWKKGKCDEYNDY